MNDLPLNLIGSDLEQMLDRAETDHGKGVPGRPLAAE